MSQTTVDKLEKAASVQNELEPKVREAFANWKKILTPVLIAAVAVLVISLIVASNQSKQEAKRAEAFSALYSALNDGLYDAAKTTTERNPILVSRVGALKAVMTNHPGSAVEARAQLHIGQAQYALEAYDEADAAFDAAIAKAGQDRLVVLAASLGKADILSEQRKFDEAITAYNALAADKDVADMLPALAVTAKFRAAMATLAKGDKDLARSQFQAIVDEKEQSEDEVEADYAKQAEKAIEVMDILPVGVFAEPTADQKAAIAKAREMDRGDKVFSISQ